MRASDRAYQALRDQIVNWELTPGTVLGEVEQSNRLGISRTPLREAFAHLAADGLVAPLNGRSLIVTEVNPARIAELYEARQGLEQQAARLAAARRDPLVFEHLRDELEAVPDLLMNDDVARHNYYDLVRRLDVAMDEATQNSYLVQAIVNIRTHMARIRRYAVSDTNRLLQAAQEHRLIAEAVIMADPDLAASATHIHLHASLTNVLAGIECSHTADQHTREFADSAT